MDDLEHVRLVYDASYRRLVGQLVGITGSPAEAEDVVQEAFARAVDRAAAFRRTDNPEAWLRRVAVNIARSRWRRLRTWARLSPRLVASGAYDDLGPDRLAVLTALRALPTAQREAIALHHIADLPVHEVAEILDVPVGTVKARLSRGRATLALLLADADEEGVRHG